MDCPPEQKSGRCREVAVRGEVAVIGVSTIVNLVTYMRTDTQAATSLKSSLLLFRNG